MKTIGLLGGMSWESTVTYYQLLNRGVREALGGLHSARILLHSFDFADIEALQVRGDWAASGRLLAEAAQRLEGAGADMILICTNTMHKVADEVEAAVSIPLIHIADATAQAAQAKGFSTLGLLGSRFTMEQDFYKARIADRHGIKMVTPDVTDRTAVHDIIYDQLCQGIITEKARATYVEIIGKLRDAGADAVILGCTEIGLLVREKDTPCPLLDTTALHCTTAVEAALT